MSDPSYRLLPLNSEISREETRYRTKLAQVNAPHEQESWYWHLYFDGEKVNGGLSDTEAEARSDAYTAKLSHNRNEWCRHYTWSHKYSKWVPRS